MKKNIKAKTLFLLLIFLLPGLLYSCINKDSGVNPALVEPPATTPTVPSQPTETPSVNRVDVVYFHLPQRCVTCLCFEEQVRFVIETYFQKEIRDGKLTLKILDLSDRNNAKIIQNFSAFGSQLFINTIKNNTDNIKDIKEIWDWHCANDRKGFDEKIKKLIEQSLKEISL